MQLHLHPELKKYFADDKPIFDQIMALQGERYRLQKGRLTQRIKLGEKHYFIKQYYGPGWREIIKNILQFRWPVLTAHNEWQALQRLQSLSVPVPAIMGFGWRGRNPARRQSFILLEELAPVRSLEEIGKEWQHKAPAFAVKKQLLLEVARMARKLHGHGLNHRDFYLCHFLLRTPLHAQDGKNPIKLYLLDLHRAMLWQNVPQRWLIKDLAGLYFSSQDIGLTKRDWYRFMCAYRQQSLRAILHKEKHFWQKVKKRGDRLYQRFM